MCRSHLFFGGGRGGWVGSESAGNGKKLRERERVETKEERRFGKLKCGRWDWSIGEEGGRRRKEGGGRQFPDPLWKLLLLGGHEGEDKGILIFFFFFLKTKLIYLARTVFFSYYFLKEERRDILMILSLSFFFICRWQGEEEDLLSVSGDIVKREGERLFFFTHTVNSVVGPSNGRRRRINFFFSCVNDLKKESQSQHQLWNLARKGGRFQNRNFFWQVLPKGGRKRQLPKKKKGERNGRR